MGEDSSIQCLSFSFARAESPLPDALQRVGLRRLSFLLSMNLLKNVIRDCNVINDIYNPSNSSSYCLFTQKDQEITRNGAPAIIDRSILQSTMSVYSTNLLAFVGCFFFKVASTGQEDSRIESQLNSIQVVRRDDRTIRNPHCSARELKTTDSCI
jgi:hypothetical protein